MRFHNPLFFIICFLAGLGVTAFSRGGLSKEGVPEYRVAIDPGHGGVNINPPDRFGDRYDAISGRYLGVFKEGATSRGVKEYVIMYQIGVKVKRILELTETDEGFETFRTIAAKFTDRKISRAVIHTMMSRPEAPEREELVKIDDPNAEYRLFDYPSPRGGMSPGRISSINAFKPHLVVSLHCAESTSRSRLGMNAVICAPYSILSEGLEYLQGKRKERSFFYKSQYADWFEESNRRRRTSFQWFLNDVSVYFAGFHLDRKNRVEMDNFMGYRFNMVSWKYADSAGWEKIAVTHPKGSRYADNFDGFIADGPYWDRERSLFEEYRRGNGYEGYGGDNHYASTEIIRYVLSAIDRKGYRHRDLTIAPPYISVWSVPLYVNAVSAYIELGYIRMLSYRHVLTQMQDDVAEGIAVGIYSLLVGMESPPSDFKYRPRGKRIDLDKYRVSDMETYFDLVVK
jgi:N-acetylmuramoyl-L-alanine amidase